MIDLDILKRNSLIHGNVDTKQLGVILERSKFLYLRPILGIDLFEYLDNLTVYSANEQTLIDNYIYPYVTVSTEIMASKHLNWEIRNKSVGVSNDTYQRANSWSETDKFINDLLNQAQMYKVYLIDYLTENNDLFPLFKTHCGEDLKGNSMSTQFGFVVNRKNRKG